MQTISLEQATPGMVLAKDVVKPEAASPVLICGRGMELTEALLERLHRIGITRVTVQGRPVAGGGEEATLEDLLAGLDARFKRHESDPLMAKLKDVYRRLIIQTAEM